MTPRLSSTNSGNMPFLLRSASVASATPARSQSLSEPSQQSPNAFARRPSALEALTRGFRKKSEIDVVLDGQDQLIRTYATFDQIKGHVEINFDRDTLIDDLYIAFEGQALTYVEKIASASPSTGRTTGKHTFLRMQQPIAPEDVPADMIARAGQTYIVPFSFVVPERLLSYICSHKVENDDVRQAHLQLPPSLGEPMLSGEGNVLMDDLAPEMSKIIYCVKAKIAKANPGTRRIYDVEEKAARIRIAPSREEEPPMQIEPDNAAFALRNEKNVRKGIFKIGKKLGRLTAEVSQPKSLRLPHPNAESPAPVTTMAAVTLRFDPASENEQPPQLGSMAARLRVLSFFGAAAYREIPGMTKNDNWSAVRGMYPDSISLSCRNIGSVQWTKRDPENRKKSVSGASDAGNGLTRRESTMSAESESSANSDAQIPEASSAYNSNLPFYTAKVLVPVSLPHKNGSSDNEPQSPGTRSLTRGTKKVIFVPSFHTCIVSRTYTLELNLSFQPVNAQGNTSNALSTSSISLKTPIQISQEGSARPEGDEGTLPFDLSLIEGTDEYDEAMARHLDQELNFTNPFSSSRNSRPGAMYEAIPEYEEVETTFSDSRGVPAPRPVAARSASIAVPPTMGPTGVSIPGVTHRPTEQPPEYYSPFRTPGAGSRTGAGVEVGNGPGVGAGVAPGARRHTVVTSYPPRCTYVPLAFLNAL